MILEKFDISQLKNKKILAFGAHPDDIEFGAGGTLAQFSGQNSVEIIIATDGGLGTHDQKLKNGDIVEILIKTGSHPTQKWLDIAKTTIAKKHIKAVLETIK